MTSAKRGYYFIYQSNQFNKINKMEELINYEQLRLLALNQGIADNRVSIGLWAKVVGYKKVMKQKNYHKYAAYYKEDK